jgi:hypothetical protein
MAVGDVYRYASGTEYIETDNGPNVWTVCYQCGADACSALDRRLSDVRCGQCLARSLELLPGQRLHSERQQFWRDYPRAIDAQRVLQAGGGGAAGVVSG